MDRPFKLYKRFLDTAGVVVHEEDQFFTKHELAHTAFAAASNELRRERPSGEVLLFLRGERILRYAKDATLDDTRRAGRSTVRE